MTENNETTVDSRIYEVSFIFDNKIELDSALKKADALKQSIATLGGSFISEEVPYMRELAYEMIRVQNNINVRFNEGYLGWIKFEIDGAKIKEIEKSLKLDEQVVRFLVVKTSKDNTVFTRKAPIIKIEDLKDNETDFTDIDTTLEDEGVDNGVIEDVITSEEIKEEVK